MAIGRKRARRDFLRRTRGLGVPLLERVRILEAYRRQDFDFSSPYLVRRDYTCSIHPDYCGTEWVLVGPRGEAEVYA